MPKPEQGTAAYISKKLKSRGLQKLRFYCQVCHKQCRDDNGFRSHTKSPSHLRNMTGVTADDIEKYTEAFEASFLKLLKMSHGEKQIEANKFYNEFIQDRDHVHMNATRFTSLSKFIQYLGKQGKIRVHGLQDVESVGPSELDTGRILISYVNNSSDNVLRKSKILELEEAAKSEQELKDVLLRQQIEQSRQEPRTENASVRKDNTISLDKISLSLNKAPKPKDKKQKVHKNVFY